MKTSKSLAILVAVLAISAGCKKNVAAPAKPLTPATPSVPVSRTERPVIGQFTAEPSTVNRGEAVTLRWSTQNANSVTIEPGVGPVDGTGSRQVFPNSTTTYRIVAAGPGGTADASRSVTVLPPSERTPDGPKPVPPGFSERIGRELADVFFDYDKSEVREDARATLQRIADAMKAILRDFPNEVIQVEGHCDERGSAEYNLGLGDRRATSTKEFLVSLGVDGNRLKIVSYGKERPQCSESTEDCWQKNRRAHFAPGQ